MSRLARSKTRLVKARARSLTIISMFICIKFLDQSKSFLLFISYHWVCRPCCSELHKFRNIVKQRKQRYWENVAFPHGHFVTELKVVNYDLIRWRQLLKSNQEQTHVMLLEYKQKVYQQKSFFSNIIMEQQSHCFILYFVTINFHLSEY